MQEKVRKYLTKLKKDRRLHGKQLVMLAACLLVVSGVFGMMIMPGLGQEGELVCEKTEHTHTDECMGNICGQDEHSHSDDCMECTCGQDEHEHSDDCKKYTCESDEEDHEHTGDCSYEYDCGKEEHEHSDSCMECTCGKEAHEHNEECVGVVCGQDEHEHDDECYEKASSTDDKDTEESSVEEESSIEEESSVEEIEAPALLTTSGESNVDEGLVVKVWTEDAEALSGETLKVNVRSQYSSPNKSGSATIRVNISKLPEGVSLVGFVDGKYELKTDTDNTVIINLVTNDDGSSYIWYEQALGDTVALELTFESVNGIMNEESGVTVEIDTTETKMATGVTGDIVIAEDTDSATLTWTAANNWDDVEKTVTAEKIAVTAENKLTGTLTYTITANSLNNENLGEIWTKYVMVTDTLTLPSKISLPDGAKVDGNNIVTKDGDVIITFTKLQGGKVLSLEIGENNKTVTYELKIPNAYLDKDDVPTKEMDHLALEMTMDTYFLKLADDFILEDKSVVEKEIINNHVEITPNPYKGEPKETSDDAVDTIPTLASEEYDLTKTADKDSVKAGEEITYTITLENTGETPLSVVDEKNAPYTVTDELPVYLYLTDEQIEELKTANSNCTVETKTENEETTYIISWVPATEKITKGKKISLTFAATVKDDDSVLALDNGAAITNSAEYKGKTVDCPVKYREADISVKKTGAIVEGESTTADGKTVVTNGGTIEYTITVTNNTDVDAVNFETVTDSLPKGLTFVSATIGETTINGSVDNVVLHEASDAHNEEHTVDFTILPTTSTQQLHWNVGKLGANEVVTLTFKCSVNTDELESSEEITNTVTLSSGKTASCVIGVDNPLKLDKKVKLATDDENAYVDGITVAYPNGTVFDYKLVVSNDATIPSQKKVVLVDQMPAGMLPENVTLLAGDEVASITWEEFVEQSSDTASYTAVVGGYTASVENVDGAVKFTWKLDVIEKDNPVTITYKAKLADANITSGTLVSYTNTAAIGDIEDSVTVKGGNNTGKLSLQKQFWYFTNLDSRGYIWWQSRPGDENDPLYQISFTIKGEDKEGNPVIFKDGTDTLTITLADFEWTSYVDASGDTVWCHRYENDNLPEGTYTVTESNYDCQDGFRCYPQFDLGEGSSGKVTQEGDTAKAVVEVENNATTIADVVNAYYPLDTVNLQKSVYEIAKIDIENDTWNSLSDKSQFYISDDTGTYIVYNVSVSVSGYMGTSGHYTKIASLKDKLPDELSYVGICYANYHQNGVAVYSKEKFTDKAVTDYFYLNYGTTMGSDNGLTWARYVTITSEYDEENNEVSFNLQFPKGELGETYEQNEFPSNNFVSFLMLCKVNDDIEEGQEITNTMELSVEDPVFYTRKDKYLMFRTPNDATHNDGDTWLMSGGDGTGEEPTVLTSSVTVIPENTIVPGIEKEAVSYILQGSQKENDLDEESSIVPNSAVKWEVTVHNDGTEPLENYTIQDVVTTPFHFITAEEASSFGITTAYKYEIYTFDGTLSSELDITDEVYKTITNGSAVSDHTFDFAGEEYSIPPGGYAVLTMYTNNTVGSYKAYKNTATIYPSEDFAAGLVEYGDLIKDDNGKYVGVAASDTVYAFGEFATVSWKTIAEKNDASNAAKCTDSKNYIVVENNSRDVVYTNNIKNISKNDFTDVVIIDVMPMLNDRGVVNQKEKRGSEFQVLYTGNMKAEIVDSATGSVVDTPNFTIQYSEASSFQEKDFAGEESSKWHDEQTEDDKSFRVMFDDNFILKNGQTLVLTYEGRVDESAVPGAIAWNSFGYQYKCGEESLRAEPPKVGVMIPQAPIIQKEVVDSNGDVQEKDADKVFTFILWDKEKYDETATEAVDRTNAKLCEFTLSQGGYLELTELQDAFGNCVLEDGKEYMITEDTTQMPEGYELVGIGEYGGDLSESYSFVYDKEKSISILARNSVEQYVKELPKTGAFGALAYKVTGTLIVLLAGMLFSWRLIIRRKQRKL